VKQEDPVSLVENLETNQSSFRFGVGKAFPPGP